eukprot:comp21336_c1_seq1/m.29239 comp21336_c1_seq1/g.29239  ORF comp21336_c1_seq1/g.29239 comp21336_c1_seq1/m.29239 type:complete len:268 (-) comp21336_c1_seq1:508-1311(-)
MEEEDRDPKPPAATLPPHEFVTGFETVAGAYRGTCRLTEAGLSLRAAGGAGLEVPWSGVHVADGGALSAYKANKIAIECTPLGSRQAVLLKLYVDQLRDVQVLVQYLATCAGLKLHKHVISTVLHSPRLLPYYSPLLRQVFYALHRVYGAVVQLGLFFYVTNLVAVLPDVTLAELQAWLWEVAATVWASRVYTGMALVLVPLLGPALFACLPSLLALVVARHFVALLLSLTALQELHHMVRLYKDVRRLLTNVRTVAATTRKEKKFQ